MSEITPLAASSFIAMIESVYNLLGVATAAALRDTGKYIAQGKASLDELQGPSEEIKPKVFIQRACPYAYLIAEYKKILGSLPESSKILTEYMNNHGGAWVSAFCGCHQTLRITFNPKIVQIACKAGDGSIFYAENDFVPEVEAKEILKDAVCMYAVK